MASSRAEVPDTDRASTPRATSENGRQPDVADSPTTARLGRPPIGNRKSSGTIIVPRDSALVEPKDEKYDADDARAMSPRRSSNEIERMGHDTRQAYKEQAQSLQSSLSDIIERVSSVKSEHEKLESGNKFLQSYIGELMQTSKLTSVGTGKNKTRGRNLK